MDKPSENFCEVAYYYPAPYWCLHESGWVKTLLLFFDQVAILLPDYMYGRHQTEDPKLVKLLEDRGLLSVLEPKDWVDENLAIQLADTVVELLTNGVFDDLPKVTHFHELSQSRIGYSADVSLADFLVDELKARNLARPSEDGVSVPLHPIVRTTILVILGQLSRAAGAKRGLTVHPITNRPKAIADLINLLSRESMPSYGKVISFDLEPLALNMSSIPLDDVLQFRTEHQMAYRTYIRDLRHFVVELAGIENPEEQELLLLERRQEIADTAHDIRRATTKSLMKNISSLSLGIAGSAWSLSTGDPTGFALTAFSFLSGLFGEKGIVTAYSYLFDIQNKLGT